VKRITLTIGIIALLAIGAQQTMNVKPYYRSSFGDCGRCHNTPAMAYNASNADALITLDGNETEDFWGDMGNTMYIPISPLNGPGDDEHFGFVRARISQNSTHLFAIFRAPSDDARVNGSDSRSGDRDAFALLWNVNQDNFNLNMFDGMKSAEEGKMIDNIMWIPTLDETGTIDDAAGLDGVEGTVYDEAYTDVGRTTDDTNDWNVAALFQTSHGHTDYYIEMVRPLVTADGTDDVQFQYDGYYGFAVAVWNQTSLGDHWVSYEQYVWVSGVDGVNPADIVEVTITEAGDDVTITEAGETVTEDSPFDMLFAFFGLFSVGLTVTLLRRRK